MSEIERNGVVTMKGNPLTLLGAELKVGDKLPNFTVVNNALQPVTATETSGSVRIISAVPSLDTPVCDTETRRFNQEAANLPNVRILTVSMDLPFAQKRWCGAAGIDKVQTLSDYQNASFGLATGTLIKGLRLEARAIFVVDAQDVVRYVEYVPEIAQEPNYDAALKVAQELAAK